HRAAGSDCGSATTNADAPRRDAYPLARAGPRRWQVASGIHKGLTQVKVPLPPPHDDSANSERGSAPMDSTRKLWTGLAILLISSFAVLLWVGSEVHRQAPPMPERVVSSDGSVVYTRADIEKGRQVWQSIGGQQLGSIWGHGAYVAPDWGADWMHREAEAILDRWAAREHGLASYKALDAPTQAAYAARVQALLRPNTWDAGTDTITVDPDRAAAMAEVAAHYV